MNYYEILEVSEKSSVEVIASAYKALTKKYHPDVSKDAQATEKMKSINLAYEVLSDTKKRAEYDRALHLSQKATATNRSNRNENTSYDDDARKTAQRQEEERRRREYAKKQAQEQARKYAEEQARKNAQERYYKQEAERKAAELREKENRKKRNRFIGWLITILLLLFLAVKVFAPSNSATSKSVSTSAPTPDYRSLLQKLQYSFEWKEVSSSLASRIGYDSKNKVLAVTFKDSGNTYLYYEVPQSVWKGISTASSIKEYYNSYINGYYNYQKVG